MGTYAQTEHRGIFTDACQVFDKIKAAWDKLVEWIGFIFSWNDILETRDTINSVINAGLDFGAQKVEDVAARADAMFVGLLGDVDKFMVAPKGFAKISGDSASSNDHDGAVTTCTSSTKFNWAGERLKNGGAGTSSRVQTSGKSPCMGRELGGFV